MFTFWLTKGSLCTAGTALVIFTSSAQAAVWIGDSTSDWNDPANWDPPGVPDPSTTIELGRSAVVPEGLTFHDLRISGGTIRGSFTISGRLEWSGGTLAQGTATLLTGSTTELTGPSRKSLDNYTIENSGEFTWSAPLTVYAEAGSRFQNNADGLFVIAASDNAALLGSETPRSTFVNTGTIRKTGSARNFAIRVPFENTGTVHSEEWNISLQEGGKLSGELVAPELNEIVLTGGDFELNGTITAENLVLDGGVLLGQATLHGTVIWRRATFLRLELEISEDASLSIEGGSAKTLDNSSISTAGVIAWHESTLNLNNGSELRILPPGSLEIHRTGTLQMRQAEGTGSVHNLGTIRKLGDTSYCELRLPIHSSGTLAVEVGELRLSMGGSLTGNCLASEGSTISLTGGDFTLDGRIAAENLEISGGKLLGTHSIAGSVTWTGGTFERGTTTIEPGSDFRLAGSSALGIDAHTILNHGRAIWTSGNVNADNGAVWENSATGRIDIQLVRSGMFRARSGTPLTLRNFGTIRKSETTESAEFHGTLENAGLLSIDTEGLVFGDLLTQTAGELRLEGSVVRAPRGIELQGGTLSGNGTIAGPVVNGAIVRPGEGTGTLTIDGDFTQVPNGVIVVEVAGLNPGSEVDQLIVTRSASLDGALQVQFLNDFLPAIGNVFTVIEYSSHTGSMTLNDPSLALDAEFTAETLNLLAVREPDFLPPITLSISNDGAGTLSIKLDGQEGRTYLLQSSTDFGNWTDLVEVTGMAGGALATDTPPGNIRHRFYRAVLQNR